MTSIGAQFLQRLPQSMPHGANPGMPQSASAANVPYGLSQNAPQNIYWAPQGVSSDTLQKTSNKSDMLQKYLAKSDNIQTNSPSRSANQANAAMSAYVPSSTMQIPSVLNNPDNKEEQKDPKKIKKAKIAAISLGTLVLATGIALLSATKAGRNLVGGAASFVMSNLRTLLGNLSKDKNNEWADKVYKKIHKLTVDSGSASGILENITNGKDVLCRSVAEELSGKKLDGSSAEPAKNKVIQFVRDTIGKVFGLYHKLDNKTTGFYKSKVKESTIKRYQGAMNGFDDVKSTVSKILEELKTSPRANESVMYNGKEMKVSEVISEVESLLCNIKGNLDESFSAEKIAERLDELNKFMMDDGTGKSLAQKTTDGFIQNIRQKNFKSIITRPIAGGILKDKKAAQSALIGGFKGRITNSLNAVLGANKDIVSDLRKAVNPDDIDSIRKLDDLIKAMNKYKKANLDISAASKEALDTIFAKIDDLRTSVGAFAGKTGAENIPESSAKIIQTLDSVESAIKNMKTGETEELMNALRQILEPETYVDIVKPGIKRFQNALNKACSLEMNDTIDKLRDVNCGSAPSDIGGMMLSTGLLGLYAAQADDTDERVGVALTTGLPILSTMGTCLFAAINQISAKKALLLGSAVGLASKTICDGLNKLYRKHRGLDENAKPSIVTIDDYINPYINKFEQTFFEPVNTEQKQNDNIV